MSGTYALVTPSYWRDVERCKMLVESVNRWVTPDVRHYLVIANRDLHLFRHMLTPRTELIVVEDIIPRWLFRVPYLRRFWLSRRTLPVRNWILQQIVKLSVPAAVTEDVLLYADSDMFFIEKYDPRNFEREGRVPLFVETGQRGLIPHNDEWHITAARLLGVPAETTYDTNYINQLIWWRRESVLAALQRVESVQQCEWAQAIASLIRGFSEYTFYGVYVDRVAGAEHAGHWHDGEIRTLNYWEPTPLNRRGLESLKSSRQRQHHSVMVSAKSDTAVEEIRCVFFGQPALSHHLMAPDHARGRRVFRPGPTLMRSGGPGGQSRGTHRG
jgi:hypothetical protein